MKKLIYVITAFIMLLCLTPSVSAYDIGDDINESFLFSDAAYLTKETKAGEIKYFGERIKIKDKNGNFLSADDYIKSGDEIVYFDTLDLFTVVLVGDCNCDGRITSADARIALRLSANLDRPYDYENCHGAYDSDHSGTISASDARNILRYSAKLDKFSTFEKALKEKMDKLNSQEYEYTHDMVMVCMNPEYVNNEEAYTPEFYGDLVSKVEKWISYSDTNVWLKIYLKEPSKENLDALYEQCKKHDAIISTDKNHIFYLEW